MAKRSPRSLRNILMHRLPVVPCCFCGVGLWYHETTLEHVVPKSQGGTNHLANLRLSCEPCNNGRGDMDYGEFHTLVRSHGQAAAIEMAKALFRRRDREALCVRWHID